MSSEQLTIVYKLDSFSPEFALQGIESVLAENHVPLAGFRLFEEPVALAEALTRLNSARRKTFNIVGQEHEFNLACVRNFRLDALQMKSASETRIPWDTWASRFIGSPNFVMAWLADSEYEHWQNAEDLLEYTAVGRPHEHLPKKSNGLPPPLEQIIVDISGNPGRRLLRTGYYEAVGAVMWLGEPFWQMTSANRSEVERSRWLQVSKLLPTVVRIEASAKCFTTVEGRAGELQRELRTLLFPESE